MIGLDRTRAAEFITRRTQYRVAPPTLISWEQKGLLRHQAPGNRVPANCDVHYLLRGCLLAGLRRDGASLQRVRRALRELGRFIPEALNAPGEWRLCVMPSGHVVRAADHELLELTRAPGQLASVTLTLFDAGGVAREARAAVERKAGAA